MKILLLFIAYISACCYSPKRVDEYGFKHVLCDNKEYLGYEFVHVLPGKFNLCNTSCPEFDCVSNITISTNKIDMQYFMQFGECFRDLPRKYFCN